MFSVITVSARTWSMALDIFLSYFIRSAANPIIFSLHSFLFLSLNLSKGRNLARPIFLSFKNFIPATAVSSVSTTISCLCPPNATSRAIEYFFGTVISDSKVPWTPFIFCSRMLFTAIFSLFILDNSLSFTSILSFFLAISPCRVAMSLSASNFFDCFIISSLILVRSFSFSSSVFSVRENPSSIF